MISSGILNIVLQTQETLTGIGEHPDFSFSPDFLFKICLAIAAGLLIGMEREYKGKDAGLKTNMQVSVGACAFVLVSLEFQGGPFIDLTRVIGQVVTGIGFLGAGVILKRKDGIEGLTTAATVWCSAAAGCIAALYLVVDLAIFTGAVVFINAILGLIGKKVGEDD